MRRELIGAAKPAALLGTLFTGVAVASVFCLGSSLSNGFLLRHQSANGAWAIGTHNPNAVILASNGQSKTRVAQTDGQANADPEVSLVGENAPGATFERVYLLLKRNFVDAINDDSKLSHGAAASMIASLNDPDSRFVEAPELAELRDQAHGTFAGSGIVWTVEKTVHPKSPDDSVPEYTELKLIVEDVAPSSPAAIAGLQTGDSVTEVDGHWLATYNPVAANTKQFKALQQDPVAFNKLAAKLQKMVDSAFSIAQTETLMNAPLKKAVVLTISRGSAGTKFTKTLAPGAAAKPALFSSSFQNSELDLKVPVLADDSPALVAAAIAAHPDAKSVLLDLSDDPGGSVENAAGVASAFINGGRLGTLKTAGGKSHDILILSGKATSAAIHVRINKGTAGTAELLAKSLQENGADVSGETSFGSARVVQLFQLKDGSGFTLLTGHLLSAKGVDFQGKGVTANSAS